MAPPGWYKGPEYGGSVDGWAAGGVYAKARVVMIVRKQIDLKHAAEAELELATCPSCGVEQEPQSAAVRIVKTRTDGTFDPVPDEEPMILFRGRDRLAVPMLHAYRELCVADGCNDFQLKQIDELLDRFRAFAEAQPQTMKQPGVTRGR